MSDSLKDSSKLIVSIVKKGMGKKILKAAREAGAEGETVLLGRGTGIHETRKFLGLSMESEKEIIFNLVSQEIVDQVLEAVIKAGKLDQPGTGIAFVIDVQKVAGIVHLLKKS